MVLDDGRRDANPLRVWNQMSSDQRDTLWALKNLAIDETRFSSDADTWLRVAYRAVLDRIVRRLQPAQAQGEQLQPLLISLDSHRINYCHPTDPAFEGARVFSHTRVGVTERLYARALDGWFPTKALLRPGFAVLAHANDGNRTLFGLADGIMETHAFPLEWFSEDRSLYMPRDKLALAQRVPGVSSIEEGLRIIDAVMAEHFPKDTFASIDAAIARTGTWLARHAIALALFRLLAANEISGAVYATAVVSDAFLRFYILGPSRIAVDIGDSESRAEEMGLAPAERPSQPYSAVFRHDTLFDDMENRLFHGWTDYSPDLAKRPLVEQLPGFDLDGFQRLVNITQAAVVRVGASNPFECQRMPTPIQDQVAAATIDALEEAGLPDHIARVILELSLGNQPTVEDRYPWHPAYPAQVFGNARRIAKQMEELNPYNRPGRFAPTPGPKYHSPMAQGKAPYAGHDVIEAVVDNLARFVAVTREEMDELIAAQVETDLKRYDAPHESPGSEARKNKRKLEE
ncbi:uncharacterized protein LOC62_01G000024 [Vanrija pseudolonga]|uniref:Uncharacterized protein n=1 Tax=Vanrija pseudolonga TaxID=143232 RepID=A0AAF0Y2G4_9TREE|nr:hypothetical protein LOC62_01G000024 [Vanrija pseudolonga]